jgi:hypothetical protein
MPAATASDVALIGRVREADAEARAAQTRVFLLAAEWADAHLDPDAPTTSGECLYGCRAADRHDVEVGDFAGGCAEGCVGDPDGFHDPFIPVVRWDAAAPFGAAIGRTSQAGSLMMRDALLTRHRLPLVWRRVGSGEVEPHKARMLAQSVIGRPRDVSDHLDRHLAPVAHKIGRVALERAIDEAMLRLYPEQREAEQLEALDRRFATLHVDSINHVGIADMSVRGDWKDLHDFDRTLSRVAIALAAQDEASGLVPDSLDVRRSRAVGVLADPAAALALLSGEHAPAPSKRAQLVLTITSDALTGDPVAHNTTTGRAVLEQAVREWCGRTDTHLQVLPVLDLAGHDTTDAYRPTEATRRRSELLAERCVFPHCTRSAAACDHDHVVPYDHDAPDRGGPSCDCNIAPLCRHHHQLKTHAGWGYSVLDTGLWLWSDPHGQQFLRDRAGTTDVTPTRHCRRQE